jgi:hypothetical protein
MCRIFKASLRSKDLSSRSNQIMGKALWNALSTAVKRGYVTRNPADGVPIASGECETVLNFWTTAEARAFLSSDYVAADRFAPVLVVSVVDRVTPQGSMRA